MTMMGNDRDLDPFTAERLLRGEPLDAGRVPALSPQLPELLAAARTGRGGPELTGEDAAVRAFRTAHRPDHPGRGNRTRHTGTRNRVIRIQAAAALAATLGIAAAGIAAAAVLYTNGSGPHPPPAGIESSTPAPATPSQQHPSGSTTASPEHRPASTAPVTPAAPEGRTRTSPSTGSRPATPRPPYPTRMPTLAPTEYPTGYPTQYPSGYPTQYPTGYPSRFPTGRPSGWPTATPPYPTPSIGLPILPSGRPSG